MNRFSAHLRRLAWLVVSTDLQPERYVLMFKKLADFLEATPAEAFTAIDATEDTEGRSRHVTLPLEMPPSLQEKAVSFLHSDFPHRLEAGREKSRLNYAYIVSQAILNIPMQVDFLQVMYGNGKDLGELTTALEALGKVWGGVEQMNGRTLAEALNGMSNADAKSWLLKRLRASEEPAKHLAKAMLEVNKDPQ